MLRKSNDFGKIRLLVLDFDGVLTDNKVYVRDDGKEMICCSRSDGLGIELLRDKINIVVISRETNKIVEARCKKLKIQSFSSVKDKVSLLRNIVQKQKVKISEVCYLGNDISDIDCVKLAGIGCAVNDSHPDLLKAADYVTKRKGGNGAAREVCDLILNKS